MAQAPLIQQDEQGFDLRAAVGVLRWRKMLIIVPSLLFVAVAWFVAASQPPTYTATAVIVLDAQKVRMFDSETVTSRITTDTAALRSELDDITSMSAAERVADRLRATMPPPTPHFAASPPWWLSGITALAQSQGDRLPFLATVADYLNDRAGLGAARYPTAGELRDYLEARNDGRSLTIEISFQALDPETAAFVANAFAEDYLNNQIAQRDAALQQAAQWLAHRLDQLRVTLETSELALARYRAEQGLGITDQLPENTEIAAITSELIGTRSARIDVGARLAALRGAMSAGSDLTAVAAGMGSDLLEELRRQEAVLRLQVNEMRTRLTPGHPEMQPVERNLAAIQDQISAEVQRVVSRLESDLTSLATRESMLETAIARLRDGQETSSTATVRLQQLTREAEANRAIYEAFLGRYKEMTEQASISQPDGRLITAAVPPGEPDRSPLMPAMMIGLIGGATVGGGFAFAREHFHRPVRRSDDIEGLTGLPVVGLLPTARGLPFRRPEDHVVRRPRSPFTESLRAAHLALTRGTSGALKQPKVLMVSSAVPGEGKSTFCLALARLLAGDGARTLVLDADLRSSRLGRAVGGTVRPDLVDVLTQGEDYMRALHKDRKSDAMYLGARRAVANPQHLLLSQGFRDLIADCRGQFDWIIIDTPPITAVSDAALAAEVADVFLYVVRANHTSRDLILAGLRILSLCKVRVDGVVVTRDDGPTGLRRHTSRYYGGGGVVVRLPEAAAATRLAPGEHS